MGYTLNWRRHNASDIAWANSAKIIRKMLDPKTKLEVYDWGFAFTYDNDDNSICCISRDDNITFTKPNDEITPDLMRALIIMTEFGIISEVGHSHIDMSDYIYALDDVHSKHPLVSYDIQYAHFTSNND